MGSPTVLAEILGSVFVLVGLTVLNKKYIAAVFKDLGSSSGLTWLTGVITFAIGVTFVALYNVWSSNWTVLVTIFGWLTIIKGAFITLFPKRSIAFYRKLASNSAMVASGVIAIVIGVVLFYFGWNG